MLISKKVPLNTIEIWRPRYKDNRVLLAIYKVKQLNKVVFVKAKHLANREFIISGSKASLYPVENNGKISCYAVPMAELEVLEYTEDIIATANRLFND